MSFWNSSETEMVKRAKRTGGEDKWFLAFICICCFFFYFLFSTYFLK